MNRENEARAEAKKNQRSQWKSNQENLHSDTMINFVIKSSYLFQIELYYSDTLIPNRLRETEENRSRDQYNEYEQLPKQIRYYLIYKQQNGIRRNIISKKEEGNKVK